MIKNLLPVFVFFVLIRFSVISQISEGGMPVSFQKNLTKDIPVEIMPAFNFDSIRAEDAVNDSRKDIPWRFGYNFPVNFNLNNSGIWETTGKGDRIWRLKIASKNAVSINIIFGEYFVPQGGKVFIYSGKNILGAFTEKNNLPHRKLGVDLIKSDEIVVEYYEPHNVKGQGALLIEQVTHGYRDYFSESKDFGDAGSCNNNVVCPEGIPWQEQIRASAMNLVNGNTWCSGSIINNTCQDGTPYYLTANHCLSGSVSTWVFRFNYESPVCAPSQDGPYNFTVSGATLRANNGGSDFALLELSSAPPSSYNVFYAGWDRSGATPQNQTAIHHPSGDVKKISFDYDPAIQTTWNSADVWQIVTGWDDGTTEGGSSGSPLFDQNHRVIGQLYGGGAACGNTLDDNYGRFDISWDAGGAPNNELKDWLDMCNTGETFIDGYDPNGIAYIIDASVQSVENIENIYCGNNLDSVSPFTIIKNKGSDTLVKAKVIYGLDGTNDSLIWNGSLATNEYDTIFLSAFFPSSGNHTYNVSVNLPNDSADQNTVNDSKSVTFKFISSSENVIFTLNTDDYGSETSWQLKDSTNEVWYSGGGYSDVNGGQTIIDSLCLAEGCYTFVINDDFGDGLSGDNGSGTQGSYYIQSEAGDTLAQIIQVNFGNQETNGFCVVDTSDTTASREIGNWKLEIDVYPNPNDGKFRLSLTLSDGEGTLYSILGEKIFSLPIGKGWDGLLDLSSLPSGIYFLKVETDAVSVVKKIIIVR